MTRRGGEETEHSSEESSDVTRPVGFCLRKELWEMKGTISRRSFLRLATTSLVGAALVACGPTPTPTRVPPTATKPPAATQPPAAATATPIPPTATKPVATPAPAQKQVVRFTMYGHPGLVEQMVPIFNAKYPNIEVKFERSEGQGYWEKLAAAIAGGGAWDCYRSNHYTCLRHGLKNVAIDLKPLQEKDSEYPQDLYVPGALDAFALKGKRYGHPVWSLTEWLFYNKKLFDEAGVPYPTPKTTWEQYVEMLPKLTNKDSSGMITQYGANGFGSWTFPVMQHVWSAGGHFPYNDDLTAFKLDDPETIQALQDEADLMNVLKVHPSPLSPPTSPVSLFSKKVATQLDGDYIVWDQRDQWSTDFDATLFPLIKGKRVNCYWPDCFSVLNESKVKEGAYKWCAWFGADPESWAIQGAVVFPVTKRQYEDTKLLNQWCKPPRPAGMIANALEHVKTAKLYTVELHAPDFETMYYAEIDKLWRNKATAKEVCAIMQQKANEIMAKPVT